MPGRRNQTAPSPVSGMAGVDTAGAAAAVATPGAGGAAAIDLQDDMRLGRWRLLAKKAVSQVRRCASVHVQPDCV